MKSGGGKAKLSVDGYAFAGINASGGEALITRSVVTIRNTSCSGSNDNGVQISDMWQKLRWVVTATRITEASCSLGLPRMFSCSVNANQTELTLTASAHCKDKSQCTFDMPAEIYISPAQNARITRIQLQDLYKGRQDGKPQNAESRTKALTWYPR